MWKTTFNISEKNRNILKKQNKTLDKTQHLGGKNWINRTFQITDLVISKKCPCVLTFMATIQVIITQ